MSSFPFQVFSNSFLQSTCVLCSVLICALLIRGGPPSTVAGYPRGAGPLHLVVLLPGLRKWGRERNVLLASYFSIKIGYVPFLRPVSPKPPKL